jgi:hypothetical protein
VKSQKRVRVGRKVFPGHPRTKQEARAQVDVILCGLEAAAVQLGQVGLRTAAEAVMRIAAQLPALKRLVRVK